MKPKSDHSPNKVVLFLLYFLFNVEIYFSTTYRKAEKKKIFIQWRKWAVGKMWVFLWTFFKQYENGLCFFQMKKMKRERSMQSPSTSIEKTIVSLISCSLNAHITWGIYFFDELRVRRIVHSFSIIVVWGVLRKIPVFYCYITFLHVKMNVQYF